MLRLFLKLKKKRFLKKEVLSAFLFLHTPPMNKQQALLVDFPALDC